MNARRVLSFFFAVMIVVCCFSGCKDKAEQTNRFHAFEDYAEARLGVLKGTELEGMTEELFPDSEMLSFSDVGELVQGLDDSKIDGFLLDEARYFAILWEKPGYKTIESNQTSPASFGIMLSESNRGKKLLDQLNEFIAASKEAGTIKSLSKKWLSSIKPTEFEDYETLPDENGKITVAVSRSEMPLCFVSEEKPAGLEIELIIAFAKAYGYKPEFIALDRDAKTEAVASGKCDMAVGALKIATKTEEGVVYTDSYLDSPVCMIAKGTSDTIKRLADLNGKKIGVVTGAVSAAKLPNLVPNAEYIEFNSSVDAVMALEAGKVDAFPADESLCTSMKWEGKAVDRVHEPVLESDYGIIFPRGQKAELISQINEYIAKTKESGEHAALEGKWFGEKEPTDIPEYESLTGENGILRVGISTTSKPFTYVKNGKYTGVDVEFLTGFAREYGYKLEFEDTMFASVLAGVTNGSYDLGAAGFTINEERKESVDFSDPYHSEDIVVVVKTGEDKSEKKTIDDYNNARIGVQQGSYAATIAYDLFPDAEIMEYSNISDTILALEQGKIDTTPNDESIFTCLKWEGKNFSTVGEPLGVSDYGMIVDKNADEELVSRLNEYIKEIKSSGELKHIENKWFGTKEPTDIIDYSNLDDKNGTINVGLYVEAKPFCYVKDGLFAGFDVELLTLFAKEYGYNLKFESVGFSSVIAGVATGKYDVGLSGFTITEERKESVNFTEPTHREGVILITQYDPDLEGSKGELSQFDDATLGVVTGSLFGDFTRDKFPDANVKEFNTFSDVLVGLKQGKVDGIMLDEPNYNSVSRNNKNLSSVVVPEYSVEVGFGFQNTEDGDKLQTQMNELLDKLKKDGKIEGMIDKWYGKEEPSETIPLEELSSNDTTINVCIDTTRKPFVYMYEGKPVGFEIEVLYLFCKEYGYNINVSDISFASGLAGLAGEKFDLVCGGLYITPERKESVKFSDPYMYADVVMAKYHMSGFESFAMSIRESFERTFIREQRWKLIVEGIITTMVISLFSVLFGSLLGFALYMLTRSRKKWIYKLSNAIAKVYTTIIAGTPTLVVLMLLFYVVFTSPDMSGVVVAIVGFTLTFGSFVYSNLALTVSGVDNGQLEAAYALGYSRNKTFFRIVLPQAMKMFVPGYSGEIISLIKATSVVGYIAVNDLTKMGDIIRGNTYEAFFPLIAVAVIYFAITWIITGVLSILKKKTEPRKRKDKNILKGVVR